MTVKDLLVLGLVLFSVGVHAIPPAPPAVYNKIKAIAARNCVTEDNIVVADLKDTDSVKFVLQLNKTSTAGVLTIVEDGKVVENFAVTCK
ncbi:MAG: hypothetical protein WC635_09895 [Bacteriovorax sp.]|jgi:hypothetical protein